jgi:hypothetical protein
VTGAALIVACCLSLGCWSVLWRRRLRADGVLADGFPLVSRREARRNRQALSRDVRRAAKLQERSARDARRAARRSARLTAGVLGEGVALGVAAPGDEQYTAPVGADEADGRPGERAAELIGELRSMLEPLLTAATPPASPAPSAAAAPLPQRSPFASELRPRATTAAEMAEPRVRTAPMSIPRLAPGTGSGGGDLGAASDGEDAWW